jgi:heme-binding protein
MSRRLKQAAIVFVVIFAAAQLVRPSRANPRTDSSRTIQAHETTRGLATVLDRSCGDCHSNATVWPWYTQVAPVSWLMAYGVTKGRNAVNFSEWGSYSPEQQRILLGLSCQDASEGKMPGPYAWLRPETRLSAQDIAMVCAAARQADVRAGGGTH